MYININSFTGIYQFELYCNKGIILHTKDGQFAFSHYLLILIYAYYPTILASKTVTKSY